jgi:hypothetical protein
VEQPPSIPDGYSIRVDAPPLYQRVIDRTANVILLPLAWINVLALGDVPTRLRSAFTVRFVTPTGKAWTLALADTRAEATAAADAVANRIEKLGFDLWAQEASVPSRFLP